MKYMVNNVESEKRIFQRIRLQLQVPTQHYN